TDDLAETRFASLKFQLGERNLEGLDLALLSLVTVTGQVRIEGREPEPGQPVLPTDDLEIRLRWPSGGGGTPWIPPAPVQAEDGSLVIKAVHPMSYLVTARKPPAGYKISDVRYNGSVAHHNLVAVNPEARVHRLEIMLAAASGSVAVTVTDGLRPAAGATVILAPDSVDESTATELLIHLFTRATTDDEGHANIGSLLPGVYRIIAYPADA
ncbi:MAG: carboxypeptidase regulatory-like domain-containing protein, partial [bacterium]|nr:carboxypeptidase regulatory-like domain-containing protein [bacterium]